MHLLTRKNKICNKDAGRDIFNKKKKLCFCPIPFYKSYFSPLLWFVDIFSSHTLHGFILSPFHCSFFFILSSFLHFPFIFTPLLFIPSINIGWYLFPSRGGGSFCNDYKAACRGKTCRELQERFAAQIRDNFHF